MPGLNSPNQAENERCLLPRSPLTVLHALKEVKSKSGDASTALSWEEAVHGRTLASSRKAPACSLRTQTKMPLARLRPNLYRSVRVVMSDGSTYPQPSAVRMVGGMLALERDAANHPVFLGLNDASGMVDRREQMRLEKIAQRRAKREGEDEV